MDVLRSLEKDITLKYFLKFDCAHCVYCSAVYVEDIDSTPFTVRKITSLYVYSFVMYLYKVFVLLLNLKREIGCSANTFGWSFLTTFYSDSSVHCMLHTFVLSLYYIRLVLNHSQSITFY